MNRTLTPLCCALTLAVSLPALADSAASCPMSYEQYEVGVPHTDLEDCPASMQVEGAYCRLSVVAEVATIFAFAEETDCIVATKSYYDDEFSVSFQ